MDGIGFGIDMCDVVVCVYLEGVCVVFEDVLDMLVGKVLFFVVDVEFSVFCLLVFEVLFV